MRKLPPCLSLLLPSSLGALPSSRASPGQRAGRRQAQGSLALPPMPLTLRAEDRSGTETSLLPAAGACEDQEGRPGWSPCPPRLDFGGRSTAWLGVESSLWPYSTMLAQFSARQVRPLPPPSQLTCWRHKQLSTGRARAAPPGASAVKEQVSLRPRVLPSPGQGAEDPTLCWPDLEAKLRTGATSASTHLTEASGGTLPGQQHLAATPCGQQASCCVPMPPSSLIWCPSPVLPSAQRHCGSRQDTSEGPAPTSSVGRPGSSPQSGGSHVKCNLRVLDKGYCTQLFTVGINDRALTQGLGTAAPAPRACAQL